MRETHSAEYRRCLIDRDVASFRRLWRHTHPQLEQPGSDHDALVMIHVARTQAESVPLKARAYSHRWLLDHDLPSTLPDVLRPRAERMYPKRVQSVGVGVIASSPFMVPIAAMMQADQVDAVRDAYANGDTDPVLVKRLIKEAGENTLKKLLGSASIPTLTREL